MMFNGNGEGEREREREREILVIYSPFIRCEYFIWLTFLPLKSVQFNTWGVGKTIWLQTYKTLSEQIQSIVLQGKRCIYLLTLSLGWRKTVMYSSRPASVMRDMRDMNNSVFHCRYRLGQELRAIKLSFDLQVSIFRYCQRSQKFQSLSLSYFGILSKLIRQEHLPLIGKHDRDGPNDGSAKIRFMFKVRTSATDLSSLGQLKSISAVMNFILP